MNPPGACVAYVRTVKTSSGAAAVQIVRSSRRGSRSIEHLGSARDEAQLEALKAAAAQRLAEGQQVLDLGLADTGSGGAPLEIISSQASHLWDGLCRAYCALGFDSVLSGDEVLRDLVLARIIEPTARSTQNACSPRPESPLRPTAPSNGAYR
jgi:hypothetical protein